MPPHVDVVIVFRAIPLSPADRIRLIHGSIYFILEDGSLGVIPGGKEWDLMEPVAAAALHDHDFIITDLKTLRSFPYYICKLWRLFYLRDRIGK
jgi:hypothetical protein